MDTYVADNHELITEAPIGELIHKPVWSFSELAKIFGLPASTLEGLAKDHPARFFVMGRRRFIKQADAMDWLDDVAAANPYYPRKNFSRGVSK